MAQMSFCCCYIPLGGGDQMILLFLSYPSVQEFTCHFLDASVLHIGLLTDSAKDFIVLSSFALHRRLIILC